MDNPKCFYHPNEHITNICLHSECILPLCDTCFKIHKKEHPHGEHLSRVVPFKEAKTIAISAINNEIQDLLHAKADFDKTYNEFKTSMKDQLNKILEETYAKLKSEQFNYDFLISKLDPKITNIQQNSLKEIIHHYEHGNIFNTIKYNFEFIPNSYEFDESVKKTFFIQEENFAPKEVSICDSSVVQKTPSCFSAIDNLNQQIIEKENDPEFGFASFTAKRKSRQGIFVASSPKHASRLQKCYSTDFKKHHESHNEEDTQTRNENYSLNKNNQNTPSSKSKLFKTATKAQSEKHFSINKDKNSFPDKILIYKESPSLKRLDLSRKSETKTEQKTPKSLSDVINKNSFASNSCSSKLITKRSDQMMTECLNPQQMRDLIMKKRGKTNEISTTDKILYIKTKI